MRKSVLHEITSPYYKTTRSLSLSRPPHWILIKRNNVRNRGYCEFIENVDYINRYLIKPYITKGIVSNEVYPGNAIKRVVIKFERMH